MLELPLSTRAFLVALVILCIWFGLFFLGVYFASKSKGGKKWK